MKLISLLLLQLCLVLNLFAQEYIPLWPEGKMPNSKGMDLEHIESRQRVTQVKTPGIYPFITSKEENKGSAVLIFPPGGYQKLTYNIAGFQLAKWYNTIGVNAFVVMYRLPTSPDLEEKHFGPLQDAQRAMKIVRSRADEWGIDRNNVGVMGCSAGGHLAGSICTFTYDYSAIGDSLDHVNTLPNFQVLVSSALSFGEYGHKGSRNAMLGENPEKEMIQKFSNELNVTDSSPKAFIVHASDDPVVDPMNSLLYYQALREHNVDACLHIFPHGKHAIALRNNPGSTNLWTHLCEAWLKEIGMISD